MGKAIEFPDINSKEFKERIEIGKRAFSELYKRYKECDEEGHYSPDIENNYCIHCFRHLEYSTPKVDAILKERSKLPVIYRPLDAPVMMQKRLEEIEIQKAQDRTIGLKKIIELFDKK